MKKFFMGIFVMFMVFSCSFQKSVFILDNPTDTAVNVKIDGKEYSLGAGGYEKMNLKPGKHTLTDSQGKEYSFIIYADSKGGIINPTRSDYICKYGLCSRRSGRFVQTYGKRYNCRRLKI